jgi:hypothetical protein
MATSEYTQKLQELMAKADFVKKLHEEQDERSKSTPPDSDDFQVLVSRDDDATIRDFTRLRSRLRSKTKADGTRLGGYVDSQSEKLPFKKLFLGYPSSPYAVPEAPTWPQDQPTTSMSGSAVVLLAPAEPKPEAVSPRRRVYSARDSSTSPSSPTSRPS